MNPTLTIWMRCERIVWGSVVNGALAKLLRATSIAGVGREITADGTGSCARTL